MENSRQTKLIRVLAFIFTLIGANGIYASITSNNERLGLVSFAILIISGFAFWYLGKSKAERKDPDAFLAHLRENRDRINGAGWNHKGYLITPDTVLSQYDFTFSLITLSFKIPSRYYIVGQENTGFVNLIYTSMNLLLGWWGIPMGPIFTLQSLLTNLKGGYRVKVASVLSSA